MTGKGNSSGFAIGKVAAASVRVFADNFAVFALLTVAAKLPFLTAILLGPMTLSIVPEISIRSVTIFSEQTIFTAFFVGFDCLLSLFAINVFLDCTLNELSGHSTEFKSCFKGFPKLAGLSPYLLICGFMPFATFFFIVPGLVLATLFWVAIPVVAIERHRSFSGFRRSAQLTKGHRWRVCALAVPLLGTVAVVGPFYFEVILLSSMSTMWILSVCALLVFFFALAMPMSVVSYCVLRKEKEGVGIDRILADRNRNLSDLRASRGRRSDSSPRRGPRQAVGGHGAHET